MATKYEKYYSNHPRPSVSVTKTVSVHPKILHPHKLLSLSSLDRQCPTLMYLVFFYKINPNIANNNNKNSDYLSLSCVFNSLKSGLEETLAIWYPAAGRLSFDDQYPNDHQAKNNNNNKNKLNLWCNNKGAILAEAITEAKISDFGDLSQYNGFFESLVFKPDFDSNFSDMPLVVAQVTKFGCGGYSIGIGTSHSLFDGPAAYNFISAWASSSDIMKLNKSSRPDIFKPVHERATLLTLVTSSSNNSQLLASKGIIEKMASQININNSNNFHRTGASAIDHLLQLIMQYSASQGNHSNTNYYQKDFVFKTFHLSGSFIEGLKRKILEENSGFSCSSFEIVAALLWKARTKAMGLKKEAMVCLQFAVDTRTKVVPPLPAGFSGNAYVLASVAVSAGELETLTLKPIVDKIRGAKECVNTNYVRAYMEGLVHASQSSLPPLKELTLVSDWTRMPFHNIDFFRGVGPAFASPLVPPTPQVACFMQSPGDGLAIDVRIGLFPSHLEAFSSYFPTKF